MLRNVLILMTVVSVAVTIDQECPCPANAQCLSGQVCACETGFIGNCSIPAAPLDTQSISANLIANNITLFSIDPIQLDNYIEFTFTICLNTELTLTFYLWGETGDITSYTADNCLGSPSTSTMAAGCQQLTSPYISFGTQANGLDELLIFGIEDNSSDSQISLSVDQEVVIGVYLYYYILLALILVVAIVIAIGIGIFIYKQKRRRRGGRNSQTVEIESEYHNIEHFQQFMPLFQAEQLGSLRSICPICLQQIEAAEVVRQTPCRHAFHSSCIDAWGLKNLSCPVCRADLSYSALEIASRISIVRVDLPPEQAWEEYDIPEVEQQKEIDSVPPPKAPIDEVKYQIRENML